MTDEHYAGFVFSFGDNNCHAAFLIFDSWRDNVCERVQTGTKEVEDTEEVKIEDLTIEELKAKMDAGELTLSATKKITKEVPVFETRCEPLLA